MNTRNTMTTLSVAATLFITASAQAGVAQDLVERMETATGTDFLEARAAFQALPASAVESQRSALRSAKFAGDRWESDAILGIALAAHDHPATFEQVYAIRELTPEWYLHKRRPEPIITREIASLPGIEFALAEIALKTRAIYPFPGARGHEGDHLTMQEQALGQGLASVLGDSKHPVAGPILARLASDEHESLEVRRIAAIALGRSQAGQALSVLTRLYETAEAFDLRLSALQGLSALRSKASLQVLSRALLAPKDRRELPATIRGIGMWASPWAWRALGSDGSALRHEGASILASYLARTDSLDVGDDLVEALSVADDATVIPKLLSIRDDRSQTANHRAFAARAIHLLEN